MIKKKPGALMKFLWVMTACLCFTLGCHGNPHSIEDKEAEGAKDAETKLELRAFLVADPDTDCKISVEEIKKYFDESDHHVCGQLEDRESTFASLSQLASAGEVAFEFSGSRSDDILKLFTAWKGFLVSRVESDSSAESLSYLANVEPYSFKIVKSDAQLSVLRLSNTMTETQVDITIKMNIQE
jgi:hypothetical protein